MVMVRAKCLRVNSLACAAVTPSLVRDHARNLNVILSALTATSDRNGLVLRSRISGDERKKNTNCRAMFFLVPAALNSDPASMPLNELFRDEEPDTSADCACAVKNASKSLGKSSGPMPTPLSRSVSATPRGSVSQSRTPTSMAPPPEMA
jgi:hypothetical protein